QQAPPQNPIEDPAGSQRGIAFHDCHFTPIDRQEVSAAKEGVLKFIGEQVDQESPLTLQGLPSVEIVVGGLKREIAYRRLKEGDFVKKDQMVALVDPTKALNDIEFKKAKIKSSIADNEAAKAMAKEAQARLSRLDYLKQQGKSLVPAEEYSAAVLT